MASEPLYYGANTGAIMREYDQKAAAQRDTRLIIVSVAAVVAVGLYFLFKSKD